MKKKANNNIYFWTISLFLLACAIKWFYLAEQGYYIELSDEMPGGFNVAKEYSISGILKLVFVDFTPNLGTRPFLTTFLYALSYKISHFHPFAPFYLGILLGSVLVPMYYLILAIFFDKNIAFFSSLTLMFMANYVEQSLALTTILPGIVFLSLSVLSAIYFYRNGLAAWKLYLSSLFLTMAIFCRYENMLFAPFFIFYNFLFDHKTRPYKKVLYWSLCLASIIFICAADFKKTGDAFAFIHQQEHSASLETMRKSFTATGLEVRRLFRLIFSWYLWFLGLAGIVLMLIRNKGRIPSVILASLSYFFILFFKMRSGTLPSDENYFLIPSLTIIPLAFWCVGICFSKLSKPATTSLIISAVITVFLIRGFHESNLRFERLKYPKELIAIAEDLRERIDNHPLYISRDDELLRGEHVQSMLHYLNRDPVRYYYEYGGSSRESGIFYLLIPKENISQKIQDGREWDLVMEYDYNNLGLFRIEKFQEK